MSNYFDPVDPQINFPLLEEEILKFWKENKIFEKSISNRPADKTWTFLDGPPFITGLPHYGTLLSSIPKDIFPRYWTMKGFRVRRVWGWDCHGLPAENKVESKLGIVNKREIEEKIGVKKFIEECKLYVGEVSSEWEWYVDHIGRWVDFKNSYRTMDLPYMESVMWVFAQMYKKNLIYKGLRVSLYCPHCGTPISNFEVAMDADNYKELSEPANTYKYKVVGSDDTYFLAWSTTPWNKIATPALAVNPDLTYVKVKEGSEFYILAKTTLKMLKTKKYKVVEEMKGSDLIGMKFEPHYDFFKIDEGKKAFEIVGAHFVTADEGTGIVTIAAYGEEDLELMKKENIQVIIHVDDEGNIKKDVPVWGGMYYLKVNKLVNANLESRGLMYKENLHSHTIPTCWRCHTRLFYAPQDAWYVDIQSMKKELVQTNEKINWFPKHFKTGRFLKSLEAAPDWCISRSRYWGSPVPVWECECGERFVPESIKELEEKSGQKITDLHKPDIDEVTVKCDKCGKDTRRVKEVLDSWIEAGSASFAERHFPFEKDVDLKDFFPPDFIVEYTGQIRAWFYVLHVISNALYKDIAFKNVLVTGVILGTDGRKMSKNFGNYPDPKEMINKYGGDALRLYLMGTPVMHGEDALISEDVYRNQIKEFSLILWNVYNFFVTYANLNNYSPENKVESKNILDIWIKQSLMNLNNEISSDLENYDTVKVVEKIKAFTRDDLSGWYIRRSRDRMDKEFFDTAHTVLVEFTKLIAPMTPFISDVIYKNLTKEESVHLADWTEGTKIDVELLSQMALARGTVEKAHAIRKEKQIPVRQPLQSLTITHEFPDEINEVVKEELNIKEVKFGKSIELDTKITPELEEEAKARELIRNIQQKRKEMGVNLDDKIKVTNEWIPASSSLLEKILSKTQAISLEKGEFDVKSV